jgi:LysR family glycine cleavage system transcriptional activator
MRLPPLNALRVFEAAGRLQNFSAAAGELNVTPGAVSRQIKHLEEALGVRLFERRGGEIRLSSAGCSYFRDIQPIFSQLAAATSSIQAGGRADALRIWGSRFFIRLWLLPRLPDFQERHPEVDVTITTVTPNDPISLDADVSIRIGDGRWPGMRADLLMQRILTPVCSPRYLRTARTLRGPEDLRHHTLLEASADADDWRRWQEGTGVCPADLGHRIMFTSTDVAYSAALDGLGVVLGRRHFIESDIEKGNLVRPFEAEYVSPAGFYLVYREPAPDRIKSFRTWLTAAIDQQNGTT